MYSSDLLRTIFGDSANTYRKHYIVDRKAYSANRIRGAFKLSTGQSFEVEGYKCRGEDAVSDSIYIA